MASVTMESVSSRNDNGEGSVSASTSATSSEGSDQVDAAEGGGEGGSDDDDAADDDAPESEEVRLEAIKNKIADLFGSSDKADQITAEAMNTAAEEAAAAFRTKRGTERVAELKAKLPLS
jgi:hypothetical protein